MASGWARNIEAQIPETQQRHPQGATSFAGNGVPAGNLIAKLCPGHISCPPTEGPSGEQRLGLERVAAGYVGMPPIPPGTAIKTWTDGEYFCTCESNCTVPASWTCTKIVKQRIHLRESPS